MFPYPGPPGPSFEPDQSPQPSRLDVQRYALQDKQNGYREQQVAVADSPPRFPFGQLVVSLRHSFGSLLISFGNWLTDGAGRHPAMARE